MVHPVYRGYLFARLPFLSQLSYFQNLLFSKFSHSVLFFTCIFSQSNPKRMD